MKNNIINFLKIINFPRKKEKRIFLFFHHWYMLRVLVLSKTRKITLNIFQNQSIFKEKRNTTQLVFHIIFIFNSLEYKLIFLISTAKQVPSFSWRDPLQIRKITLNPNKKMRGVISCLWLIFYHLYFLTNSLDRQN